MPIEFPIIFRKQPEIAPMPVVLEEPLGILFGDEKNMLYMSFSDEKAHPVLDAGLRGAGSEHNLYALIKNDPVIELAKLGDSSGYRRGKTAGVYGTEEESGAIIRVALLSLEGSMADIVYSTLGRRGITKAGLDLERKTMLYGTGLASELPEDVFALCAVRSRELHDKLPEKAGVKNA